MAWLGVNLNDSISSIKGQISNLTRDVLSDHSAEAVDQVEVQVPRKRIKEFESTIYLYQEEIKELKAFKAAAEERLKTQDYNHSIKIAALSKELDETREQLQTSKAKSSEWKWDESSEDSKKQFSTSNKDVSCYLEKISSLQHQLAEEKRRRELDRLAFEDGSRSDSLNNKGQDEKNLRSSSFTNIPLRDDYIENEKDTKIKELEEELYCLRSERESLYEEKEQLNSNMVDLDNQHQMIIDEILKSKKALAEELKESKNEIAQLENSLKNCEVHTRNLSELNHKFQSVTQDNLSLSQRVHNLQNEQSVSLTEIEELKSLIDSKNESIEELDEELLHYKQQCADGSNNISSIVKDLETSNLLKNKLKDELSKTNVSLENSQKEIEELKKQSDILQTSEAKANEVISELNEKIQYKDEQILKFQAVVEEKTVEHTNTFRKLKQHEEMTLITIKDFQKEIQDLKTEIKDLQEKLEREREENLSHHVSNYETVMNTLMENCNTQNAEDLPSIISEMNSEVASLRCERDRLSEDLKDTQVIVDTLEAEKIDLEKECEDLRDQLEELQCGERVVPEGSLTPRPLPTIKEEDDTQCSSQFEGESENCNISIEKRTVEGKGESELIEKINELNSQVLALSEARQNLEVELSFVKKEKSETEQRLTEALSRLGNMSNLEAEAISLRNENESLQGHLNDVNKRVENVEYVEREKLQLERQIQQMSEATQRISLENAHSYLDEEVEFMRNSLEEKISEQNKFIDMYREEIMKLQSYINATNNATDPNTLLQEKVSHLQTELDKVRSVVIYKDDQIDDLKRAVEQIGSIFQLSGCDLRQTYVNIKQNYDSLVVKLKESNSELHDLKEEIKTLRKEKITKNNNENEVLQAFMNNALFKSESRSSNFEAARRVLEYQARLKDIIDGVMNSSKQQSENISHERGSSISSVELQEEEKRNIKEQLETFVQNYATVESSIHSKDDIIRELETDFKAKEKAYNDRIAYLENEIELKIENSNDDEIKILEENFKETLEALRKENEALLNQVTELKNERQQMIETSTLKHQESVTYYNEIQRLNEVIQKEEQRKSLQINSLNEKLNVVINEKEKTADELNALKLNWETTVNESVPKSEANRLKEECNRLSLEISRLNEELKKQQDLYKNLFKERDHLRMANSSFNTQYEEKSREVANLLEKEKYLTQEVQRLKQHLVEVEETYTNEAVKSEQREASLRQSLAKMHEKIASHSTHYSNENQKTVAQLDLLQEQFREATHERDEARTQLQIAQELSEQHQEALTRLQDVLQDFQKNQTREISMATEREKRKLVEEKNRNTELELQLRMVNARYKDLESTLAATASIREELQTKEDTIVALKSQVNAVNLAAKKSQEQVALLQSASDAKVDKHLLRNLFVGYFATPTDKQREVLRIVAEVLDFSPDERARTGLDQQPGSWLSSIANFLAPPPSNIRISSKVDVLDHSSLSQAFIRFLEEESAPKSIANFPAVQMAEEANQKAQKKAKAKNMSMANIILDPTLDPSSNSSAPTATTTAVSSSETTTNSLLLSSTTASLQGNFSLISTPAVSSAPNFTPTTSEELTNNKFLHNLLNSNDNNEGSGNGS